MTLHEKTTGMVVRTTLAAGIQLGKSLRTFGLLLTVAAPEFFAVRLFLLEENPLEPLWE